MTEAELKIEPLSNQVEVAFDLLAGRRWEFQSNLKTSPHRAVKELRMIGGGDHDDMGRQVVDLEEK